MFRNFSKLLVCLLAIPLLISCSGICKETTIVVTSNPDFQEALASREVRRYVYLRTGQWLSMVNEKSEKGDMIELIVDESLDEQEYRLKTINENNHKVLVISGGSGLALLYGAYHFAEILGVRFYLHGDVIPDKQLRTLVIPDLDETHKPLFEVRGINPWGSHVEGIDLWNTDDWKRVFTQMTKLRMNWLGVHSYPEKGGQYDSESTVWIGRPEDSDSNGVVTASFPSSFYNTMRSQWGHRPKKTGDYGFGASLLFEYDEWGPNSMIGYCPMPTTPEGFNEVFNRTGEMQRDAFGLAHQLGIKTCVGTESPLTIPKPVKERLIQQGKDPADPAVIIEIYRGIFERIIKTHPLDYYWIWTPEKWLWSLNELDESEAFFKDFRFAIQAWEEVDAPFELATAGWVLGPVEDRAALDRLLPPGIPVSALSEAYSAPVDPAFKRINKRQKWAIPWLEEDTGILGPQLWVSRVRKDAADALSYGCDGLMGLIWRTRPTGPALAAMGQACWSQKNWNPEAENTPPGTPESLRYEGILPPYGRQRSKSFMVGEQVTGTGGNAVYETFRSILRGYRLQVPDGKYEVTLMFCEPQHNQHQERIFEIYLQDSIAVMELDIFEQAGPFTALEISFNDIIVDDGWLDIVLEPKVSEACISGIIIRNNQFTRKINCGGPAFEDYEGDPDQTKTFNFGPVGTAHGPRGLSCDDFYMDWAIHHFGENPGKEIGKLFSKLDGNIPLVSDFDGGAGALWPDHRPWEDVEPEFWFIGEMEQLRPRVKGTGNLERFDWWLNTFRHLRSQAEIRCLWSRLNEALERDDLNESLALRKELNNLMREAYGYLFATVSTPGGMATVLNWEGHIGKRLTDPTDLKLETLLGRPVPADCLPEKQYNGPAKLIVPAVRTLLQQGEPLDLKIIALTHIPPEEISLYWRRLGTKNDFENVTARHIERGVYRVTIPSGDIETDFEYYIEMDNQGEKVVFPATAPAQNQTVVVVP